MCLWAFARMQVGVLVELGGSRSVWTTLSEWDSQPCPAGPGAELNDPCGPFQLRRICDSRKS